MFQNSGTSEMVNETSDDYSIISTNSEPSIPPFNALAVIAESPEVSEER